MKYILILGSLLLFACSQKKEVDVSYNGLTLAKEKAPFYFGVGSGDPSTNSVIIWTKLIEESSVKWEVSASEGFEQVLQSGEVQTKAINDFTVKVAVEDLAEGQSYFYRFITQKDTSVIGKTKTLPKNVEEMQIAFISCSNYEWGYFNVYDLLAKDTSIDLVIHLGDYIYEYGRYGYGDSTLKRGHLPKHEIVSLADYRLRYATYHTDESLQLLRQNHPIITTWDDHETANNSYKEGAQNHQVEKEGEWESRKSNGIQAYFEWIPVKENRTSMLYRNYDLGTLANLIILDTRLVGRSKQVDSPASEEFMDSTRTILGAKQKGWFKEQVQSKHQWKIIGNQVPFGPYYFIDDEGNKILYMDGWDGYPIEQQEIANHLRDSAKNVVFVTGDVHRSYAFENQFNEEYHADSSVSVEFTITSVSSPNDDEYMSAQKVKDLKDETLIAHPHLRYYDGSAHGYIKLDISADRTTVSYHYVDQTRKPEYKALEPITFEVLPGENRIR